MKIKSPSASGCKRHRAKPPQPKVWIKAVVHNIDLDCVALDIRFRRIKAIGGG